MIPSASLTPPLAYVGKAPASPGELHGRRPVVETRTAIDAVAEASPVRDLARFRQAPASAAPRPDDPSPSRDDGSPEMPSESVKNVRTAIRESDALALRRILDIRARSETAELVELPVPVTEILRISLGEAMSSPVAGISARSLYEDMQQVFSRVAPPSSQSMPDTGALQAA